MAIDFGNGNTTKYVAITDSADLTLPDDDWCVGMWTRLDDNSGNQFQFLLSNGNVNTAGTINLYLVEASYTTSSLRNKWRIFADTTVITSSSAPGGDGKNRLIVAQRRGSDLELYFCEAGQAASLEANTAFSTGPLNGDNWHFGSAENLNTSRFYEEHAGELFYLDRSLSSEQITALGAGRPITGLVPASDIVLYNPFATPASQPVIGDFTTTDNGSPVQSEHFPVSQPVGASWAVVTPVGGGPVTALLTDSASAADVCSASVIRPAALTDSVVAADSIASVAQFLAGVAELSTISDVAAAASTLTAGAVETAVVNDTVVAVADIGAALTENAVPADAVAASRIRLAAQNEGAAAADPVDAARTSTGLVAESGGASESLTAQVLSLVVGVISEAASVQDDQSALTHAVAQVDETSAVADSTSAIAQRLASVIESAAIGDGLTARPSVVSAHVAEVATPGDVAIAIREALAAVAEGETLSDGLLAVVIGPGGLSIAGKATGGATGSLVTLQISGAGASLSIKP